MMGFDCQLPHHCTASRRGGVITALLALLAGACTGPTEPFPSGAVEIDPPRVYSAWWQLTQSCSGTSRPMSSVRWFVVPGASEITVDGRTAQGFWFERSNRILLAGAFMLQGPSVRHEMLHALVGGSGHPREPFLIQCGGIVGCAGVCAAEAGELPQPAVDAPEVVARELDFAVTLYPATSTVSADSGWIGALVSIRNARSEDVWVPLAPTSADSLYFERFGVIVECIASCGLFTTFETWAFGETARLGVTAGMTQQLLFDGIYPPGQYRVRGYLGPDTTNVATITVLP